MKKHFNKMLTKSLVILLFASLLPSCGNSQTFKTVTIGGRVWMAENLNVDEFRNGDPIPHAHTDEEWKRAGKNRQPAWCYYDNDPANGKIYGKLYNWYAVSDRRGLSPEGWYIPSDADWSKLVYHLGGHEEASGKLKEAGTTHWLSPNTGATNETGFTALAGGYRNHSGNFSTIGKDGTWWSASEYQPDKACYIRLYYNYNYVSNYIENKELGFSVRCVRD